MTPQGKASHLIKERRNLIKNGFSDVLEAVVDDLDAGRELPFSVVGGIALTEVRYGMTIGADPLCQEDPESEDEETP